MSVSMRICTQSGQSPRQAYEVCWRSDNVCTSFEWLCVLRRAVASRQSLRVCYGHTLKTLEKILLTFNPPWLKSTLTKFEAVTMKSVGGVRSYARGGNRQNGTNLHLPLKMANFLWTWHHATKRPWHDEGVYWIASTYAKLTPTTGVFRKFVGKFCSTHGRSSTQTYRPPGLMCMAKLVSFGARESIEKMRNNNNGYKWIQ